MTADPSTTGYTYNGRRVKHVESISIIRDVDDVWFANGNEKFSDWRERHTGPIEVTLDVAMTDPSVINWITAYYGPEIKKAVKDFAKSRNINKNLQTINSFVTKYHFVSNLVAKECAEFIEENVRTTGYCFPFKFIHRNRTYAEMDDQLKNLRKQLLQSRSADNELPASTVGFLNLVADSLSGLDGVKIHTVQ